MEIYYKIVSIFEIFLGIIIAFVSFIRSPYKVLPKYSPKNNKKLFILGNGPSLSNQLNFITDNRDQAELICLNGFSRNNKYELLKPEVYLLLDPIFFKDDWDTYDISTSTLLNIKKKTDWNLLLIVPRKWKKSKSLKQFSDNKNISIGYIKNVPMIGSLNFIKKIFFKLEFSTPVFQNVLIAAIYFGINRRYKEINLFGAGHSWLNDLSVDKNNEVYLKDDHFDEVKTIKLVHLDKSPKKAYFFIKQIQIMLREYSVLNSYAELMGVRIINYTVNSHIESFEKKSI
jgi:hypothetical protein